MTVDDLCNQMEANKIKFFQRKISKGKGAGLDYLVVPVEITPEVTARMDYYESKRQILLEGDDTIFAGRNELVKRIKARRNYNQSYLDDINKVLDELATQCLESPTLTHSFVQAPKIELYTVDTAEPTTNLNSSELLEILAKQTDAIVNGREYLAQVKAEVEAWLEFAPKFALLEEIAAQLHGWMKIDGKGATVYLINQTPESGRAELKYVFSEDGLASCLDDLAFYQQSEEDQSKDNLDRLREMGLIPEEPTTAEIPGQ